MLLPGHTKNMDVLKKLVIYLLENIDDIIQKYQKNNGRFSHDDCIKIYEEWRSLETDSLTMEEWKYCIQTIENILMVGMDASTLKILLKQLNIM